MGMKEWGLLRQRAHNLSAHREHTHVHTYLDTSAMCMCRSSTHRSSSRPAAPPSPGASLSPGVLPGKTRDMKVAHPLKTRDPGLQRDGRGEFCGSAHSVGVLPGWSSRS